MNENDPIWLVRFDNKNNSYQEIHVRVLLISFWLFSLEFVC